MEKQPITPAFISNQYVPTVINDRCNIIRLIGEHVIIDICNELSIQYLPKCSMVYDRGEQMGVNNGKILMFTALCDDYQNNEIYIFTNTIIDELKDYALFDFVFKVVKIYAHECRHIWQDVNKKFNIEGMIDDNYKENYENIDYEIDADTFAEYYLASRYNYIISIFLECVDMRLAHNNSMIFDVYHFMNYMISNSRYVFNIISNMALFDSSFYNNITILPSYDDIVKVDAEGQELLIYANLHDGINNAKSIIELIDHVVYKLSYTLLTVYITLCNESYITRNLTNNASFFNVIKGYLTPVICSYLFITVY